MTRRLQSFVAIAAVVALVFGAVPLGRFAPRVFAQATMNSTTLAAALSATATSVVLASGSNISAGNLLFVDGEAMLVLSISSATAQVQRGYNRTFAQAHASGAAVWSGPPNYFAQSEVAGPCVAVDQVALPRIVIASGSIYQCSDATWVKYRDGGLNEFSAGAQTTYAAAGAITVKPGVTLIGSGGALAMTLASPSVTQNGMVMSIFASTAQAHTITTPAGFNGGTTARDVCTLGGAIGDGLVIQAWGGVWYVLSNINCTLA